MPLMSLSGTTGYLVVGTTPVRITANLGASTRPPAAAAGANVTAHTIFIQQYIGNTSHLYLLDRETGNITTGVGVIAVLVAPFTVDSNLTGLAYVTFTITYAPGGFNASDYWLVASASSQKAIASIIQS